MILRIVGDEPVPTDRLAWRERIAGAVQAEDARTPTGWPLAIVVRGAVVFGFYELFDRGIAVAVEGEGARDYLLTGDLDRTQRDIVALAQLWDA